MKKIIYQIFTVIFLFCSCTNIGSSGEKVNDASCSNNVNYGVHIPHPQIYEMLGLKETLEGNVVDEIYYLLENGYDSRRLARCFFHVELSGDKNDILIYSGDYSGEGKITSVFCKDSCYVEKCLFNGCLAGINYSDSVFVLVDRDCCDGNNIRYEFIGFNTDSCVNKCTVFSIVDMELPNEIIALEIFVSVRDSALLRMEPVVDDSIYNYTLRTEGNRIGVLKPHSMGLVLGERTDNYGNQWYFALIDKEPYKNTHFWELQEGAPIYFLGWLKKSDVELIDDEGYDFPSFLKEVCKYECLD